MVEKQVVNGFRRTGMRRIAWMVALAAAALAAGVASGRGRVDYSEVTAESLVTSPQASWARAILFTDEVVAVPSGRWKRLERKNYAEMRLRTVGTVWIPEEKVSAFEGVEPGRLYSFGGTVDQFSRRYYVILDAVFELQTGDDLSAHWTGMLDGDAGEDDPALQGVLLQVQNRLIQMAKEQGVTVAQLVEAQTDGGQRLAQVVAAEAMQSEFKAKNTTAEEVLIDSVLALLQKQVVMEGGVADGEQPPAEEAAAVADGLSMDGWDGEEAAGAAEEVAEEGAEVSGEAVEEPPEDVGEPTEELVAAAVDGAAEGDWWEDIEGIESPSEEGLEPEGMDDVLAGVEAMEGESTVAQAGEAEIPVGEEAAVADDGMVPGWDSEGTGVEAAYPEDVPVVEAETETPEAGSPEMPEDDFADIPVTDGEEAWATDVSPVAEEAAVEEMPEGEEPEESVEEPVDPIGQEPVAEIVVPEAEKPAAAGEGRIVPLGGGALTPRVSLEPTREELEAAAKQAEEEARAAEAEARRLEKEAKEAAKRQEKERKEAEAEARRLEKAAEAAAAERAKEEEKARREAKKALDKRLKEEARAAEREEESRREALAAQQAAAVQAARAGERIRNAEAAARAEREAHAAQMKEAEARRAAALAALEAAERDKAAALAKIEAESEAAYAAVEAVRAVERAEKQARYEAELEQARQIEAEERKAAEAAERRIAKSEAAVREERARLAEVEAEAEAAEREAQATQKEVRQLEKAGPAADARKSARAEEKARREEEKRLRREAEESRKAAEREARARAEREAQEERRAAEEAKSREAAQPKAADADFWSRPAKW
jgi:hypothetical protein